ncbi:hypothetical protein PV11_06179 [Exophiala sideris]|uniref:Uncharacterized protein n=1 Tax=Exophiala sideris TaxID=1016849 RepID=A0A0D1YCJ6_9EURO|nr:hypothetical protein PV11_06179 [Exophiala sideris]
MSRNNKTRNNKTRNNKTRNNKTRNNKSRTNNTDRGIIGDRYKTVYRGEWKHSMSGPKANITRKSFGVAADILARKGVERLNTRPPQIDGGHPKMQYRAAGKESTSTNENFAMAAKVHHICTRTGWQLESVEAVPRSEKSAGIVNSKHRKEDTGPEVKPH